jgi:hypothetical protein
MDARKPCPDCMTLIGSSIADEPHGSLQSLSAKVLAPGESRYYKCRSCGRHLSRGSVQHDSGTRWRLV